MSLLKQIDADKSQEGDELRSALKQAYLFGFAGVAMLVGFQFFPDLNHLAGLVPGMSFGLMAAFMGVAFSNYKNKKQDAK